MPAEWSRVKDAVEQRLGELGWSKAAVPARQRAAADLLGEALG